MASHRHLSLVRVMFWIVCLAILFAALRQRAQFLTTAIAVAVGFVLAFEFWSIVHRLAFGERLTIVLWPHSMHRVHVPVDLWAMADGYPIRVDLIACHTEDVKQPIFEHVGDQVIEGRTHLCDLDSAECEPLDLIDRGPLLIHHELYGPCLVQPLARSR